MKKLAFVLGAAAVATFTGCKDPDYVGRNNKTPQQEPKSIVTEPVAPVVEKSMPTAPIEQSVVRQEEPKCQCLPGTRHTAPCICGASNCRCVVTPPPAPAPEYTEYIVQNGDFLAKISKKFNVTIGSIKRLNNMKSDMVRVGQKLKLPGRIDVGVQTAPVAAPKASKSVKKGFQSYSGATKEYVVKNGDTLGSIAYGNGMNIRQLKELNGLKKDSIHVGQKLKIAAGGAAVKEAKKEAKVAAKPAEAKSAAAEKPAEAKPAETQSALAEEKPAATAPAAETAGAEASAAAAAPAETAPAPTQTYVVQEGDDITRIAIDFGLTPTQVREMNNLSDGDTLKPGQTIKLPADVQQ